MRHSRFRTTATATAGALAALVALVGFADTANAQLGMYTLPKDDFTWNWGRSVDESKRRFEDFSVRGGEAGFSCELTGSVSPSGRLSPSDVRALEEELRTRMDFIYAVSRYMNDFDAQRLIDWATLKCEKPEPTPSTAEDKAERESRAKEKMQREIARRRERERD